MVWFKKILHHHWSEIIKSGLPFWHQKFDLEPKTPCNRLVNKLNYKSKPIIAMQEKVPSRIHYREYFPIIKKIPLPQINEFFFGSSSNARRCGRRKSKDLRTLVSIPASLVRHDSSKWALTRKKPSPSLTKRAWMTAEEIKEVYQFRWLSLTEEFVREIQRAKRCQWESLRFGWAFYSAFMVATSGKSNRFLSRRTEAAKWLANWFNLALRSPKEA